MKEKSGTTIVEYVNLDDIPEDERGNVRHTLRLFGQKTKPSDYQKGIEAIFELTPSEENSHKK